jgi:hypothetical protein
MRFVSALAVLACMLMAPVHGAFGATLSWTFTLEPSNVQFHEIEGGSVRAVVDGYHSLEYLGYPALPYRVVSVLLPPGEDVSSCRIQVLDESTMRSPKPLAVFSGNARDDGTTVGIALDQADAKAADGLFPQWRVRYLGSGSYRGYRVASIAVYPVRFNAVTGALVFERSVRLVVETAPAPSSSDAVERMRYIEGFRAQSRAELAHMVINPEAAAAYSFNEVKVAPPRAFLPSYEPSMEGSDVMCVIVTNEAMESAFQRLADWKTKKGIPTVVRTVEWISEHYRSGADMAESIRNFIVDAYAKWGVQYVLLGGDTDVIPARLAYVSFYTGDFIPTDMYYSCLDGNWNADGDSLWGEAYHDAFNPGDDVDLYAEVYIGRMPASTLTEANILVNKDIDYATPANYASKRKFLALAEVIFPSDYHPGDQIILDGAEIAQSIYQAELAGNPNITATRLYETSSMYPGSIQETKQGALDSMNAGTNHVLHVGHGYKYNMSVGDGSIVNYDANNLTNGKALFSMYLMNCTNVAFDTDCLAEYFMLNSKGGAFAVTGSSRSAFPSASRPYLDEYYYLLYERAVVQLGKVFTMSREPYTASAYGETADRWTHFIYNYLGDPEACMFREAANCYAITKPSSVGFGPTNIEIHVTSGGSPPDSAYVCLYKAGDDYAYGSTDPSGAITFSDFLCKSAGKIYVTVTGVDHCRYVDSITVVQQTNPYLRVDDKRVYDTIVGNNDGILDAGETINLSVKLRNTGLVGATKLYAIVRSMSVGVTITDSVAVYPDIAHDAAAWPIDAFTVSAAPSIPDGQAIEFTIVVRDSTGGSWSEKFALDVHAPLLEIYVSTSKDTLPYGNNNGVIEEGEQFLYMVGVRNFGTGTAHGLSGKIRPLSGNITVADSMAAYADIKQLETKYGDGFVLSELHLDQVNYFRFELTDAYGRVVSKRMELRKPAAPGTIVLNSTYGPTEILGTWHSPDTTTLNRFQVYRSLTSGGPYTLANRDLIYYTLFLDTGLLPSTRYYYVITAVDSCGNEGPRSVEKTATTSPPQLAGWPNKMGKETASSVKIADVDGDTHSDVVCGSDYVYAWSGQGIELRDGDGQPLTWGIFNTYGSNYTATVALANLDGVPGAEIIGASWDTKQIYVFKKDGSVLPGWPQSTSSLCWASPVVGDIDGDGAPEIIAYSVGGIVYAWHVNGTEVRNGDANPATNGPFFVTKNPGTWHMSTPGLADLDEDGIMELIVCSPNDSIYALNGDGSRVPGWPISVIDSGTNITASPAIGDINGDGHLEIVIQNSAGRVFGLKRDGTSMPGWPQWIPSNTSTIAPSAALADLDKDGKLEVIIAGLNKNVYVIRYNGASYPGWPQPYSTTSTTESSPIVGDIDGDGNLDIILGCEEGKLNAWNSNGQYIAGFPIQLPAYIRGTPMLADLDLDGKLELAASCWDQNVYVWDLSGPATNGALAWNGFRANVYNTGLKDFYPATAVGQLACMYRFADDGIELSWSVVPEASSWNLYRRSGTAEFELVAPRLRPDGAGVVSYVDRTAEEGVSYRYKLEADGNPGLSLTTQDIMVPVRSVNLYQNHPNPFNPTTLIPFTVPGDSQSRRSVLIAVYDVSGSLVKSLASGAFPGGRHEVRWDGRNARGESVASGIYFVRMSSGGYTASRKMVLLR